YDVGHRHYTVHAPGSVVPDSGRHAIPERPPIGTDERNREIPAHTLPHALALLANSVPVKAVNDDIAVALVIGDDRLRVAIRRDGVLQKAHFWWGDGVGVVIVPLDLFRRHPEDAVHWFCPERAHFV